MRAHLVEARADRRACVPARGGHLQAQAGHDPPSAGVRREASSAATSSRLTPARPPEHGQVVEQVGALVDDLAVLRAPWRRGPPRSPPPPPSCTRCRCPWRAGGPCTRTSGSAASARSATVRSRSARAANVSGTRSLAAGARGSRSRRPGVAGDAGLVDQHQQRVVVAVEHDRAHRLRVAARGALAPQLLAGAAPEPGLAALERPLQRLPVHPGLRQHPARGRRPGPRRAPGRRRRSAPAPPARRRALRSRRRLPRRPQTSPFSACELGHDQHRRRRADPRGTGADHRLDGLERAHAPGRLHPDALGQGVAHQLHVVHGGVGARRPCRSSRSRRPRRRRSCRRGASACRPSAAPR